MRTSTWRYIKMARDNGVRNKKNPTKYKTKIIQKATVPWTEIMETLPCPPYQ